MTEVSRDDVAHLATLSSLQLSEVELASLQADISNILNHVDLLGELDVTGVEPTYQVTDLGNVWRDDVVSKQQISRETLLSLAPQTHEHQVKVPKVL